MDASMIEEAQGNLLAADVDALVNTVNTVGVMGKGLALQFKRAYPQMFAAYAAACKAGEVTTGRMQVWSTGLLDGPRYIINFPTKKHWRGASRLSYVKDGLVDLRRVINELGLTSIAIPPLGAGNGGLDWNDVRPLIVESLADLDDVRVLLYTPGTTPRAEQMATATDRAALTHGRAALIDVLARYTAVSLETSIVEVQKLMYFLQVAGEPLKLQYVKHHYGPYADNLRFVLQRLEGHYLTGYGDGSRRVMASEPIVVAQGADDEARTVLADALATQARIDRVLALAEGFESMYGMELLATVHWAATSTTEGAADLGSVTTYVQGWSRRKREIFTERHIQIAYDHLDRSGWLASS